MRWMFRNKYAIWFTLDELFSLLDEAYQVEPHSNSNSSTWFTSALSDMGLVYSTALIDTNKISTTTIADIVNVLMTSVYNEHYKDYIIHATIEEGDSEAPTLDELKDCMIALLNVLDNTIPKYVPLFVKNKEASGDILDKPKATTESMSRFNDTPQDSGLYDDDPHSSNITQGETTTSADMGTLVSRLDEAYKNFHSILLRWTNEFNVLFFKEEQL